MHQQCVMPGTIVWLVKASCDVRNLMHQNWIWQNIFTLSAKGGLKVTSGVNRS